MLNSVRLFQYILVSFTVTMSILEHIIESVDLQQLFHRILTLILNDLLHEIQTQTLCVVLMIVAS